MLEKESKFLFKSFPAYLLTIIRIIVGWLFLYEGIVKLLTPSWTAGVFLLESKWWFSEIFKVLAVNQSLLNIVDFLNIWGLIFIGLGLFFGLLSRVAAWSGAGLLLLYYLVHPPFMGLMEGMALEGSYIWVNKNLIIMAILILLASIPKQWMYGVDNLIAQRKERKTVVSVKTKGSSDLEKTDKVVSDESSRLGRRMVLKNLISHSIRYRTIFLFT